MSVTTNTAKVQYTLSAAVQALPVTFYFLDNSHIKAIRARTGVADYTMILGTDYTLVGAGDEAGGTLTTIATNLLAGDKITIKRDIPITQLTNYVYNDKFPAEVHEKVADKLTMAVQQLKEVTDRALQFPESDVGGSGNTLPAAADRAAKLLGFSADGTTVELFSDATIVVSGDAIQAETIAAMKLIPRANLTDKRQISVLGYTVAVDGGGGGFYWDAASVEAEDLGMIFIHSDAGVGRFKRIIGPGVIFPEYFGAKGDDATDDGAAIQAAIDCAAAIRASTSMPAILEFCPKSYRTNVTDLLVESALIIKGNGAWLRYSGTGEAFKLKDNFNSVASNLKIQKLGYSYASPIADLTGSGFVLENSSFGTFKNIYTEGFSKGIDLIGNGAGTAYNTFNNPTAQNCTWGLSLRNINVVGSYCNHNTFMGGQATVGAFADLIGSRGISGVKNTRSFDGNKFYGFAPESLFPRKLYWEGDDSAFRDFYWDQSNGGTDIELTATSNRNIIDGGATIGIMGIADAGTKNHIFDPGLQNTFVPVVAGTTAAGAGTYTTQRGSYTKIGRVVFFEFEVGWSAHTGTGDMTVTGLVFAVNARSGDMPVTVSVNSLTYTGQVVALLINGQSAVKLYNQTSTNPVAAIPMAGAGVIRCSGHFTV